jgi:hypothetical protein
MANRSRTELCRAPLLSLSTLLICAAPLLAGSEHKKDKILAGFFEEWSIYYAKSLLLNNSSILSCHGLSYLQDGCHGWN